MNETIEITDGYITTTGSTEGDTSVLDYNTSASITGGRNNGRLKDKKKAEPIISVLENRFRHSS